MPCSAGPELTMGVYVSPCAYLSLWRLHSALGRPRNPVRVVQGVAATPRLVRHVGDRPAAGPHAVDEVLGQADRMPLDVVGQPLGPNPRSVVEVAVAHVHGVAVSGLGFLPGGMLVGPAVVQVITRVRLLILATV